MPSPLPPQVGSLPVPALLAPWLESGDRLDAVLAVLAVGLFWALLVIRRRQNEAVFRTAVLEAFEGNLRSLERWRAHDSAWGPFAEAVLDRISRRRSEVEDARDDVRRAEAKHDDLWHHYAQVPTPVFVLDQESRIVEANREACRLFGRSREEVVGHGFDELFRRRTGREGIEWLEALLPLGLHGEAGMEVVRMDGTTEPVVFWGRPIDGGHGDEPLQQIVAVDVARLEHPRGGHEVDERHHQEQVLESMGRLASGVAHDFNNHLTTILGHGMILREKTKEDPAQGPHAEEVCQAAEQARQLTKELLAFSRTQVAYPELLDVNEVLLAMRQAVLDEVGERVRLDLSLGDDLEKIRMDRSQLEEVVLKLVTHARDSMRGEGAISIETERVSDEQEWVVLRVTDTGRGMDAESRTHAFEPYYTTNQGEFGSGMGLASVHGAVTQNHGRISIQSDLGRGTRIELHFPVIASSRPGPDARRVASAAQKRTTVCVIEDDSQVRRLISSVLEREGFRVLTASDGIEGLELCLRRSDEIDIVLADVNLPSANGVQLSVELKRNHPEMPILHMSGYLDEETFQTHGAFTDGFLQKPFTPGELTHFIREALRGKSRRTGAVRILVVDDEEPVRNMLRTLLRGLGYECGTVADGDAALAELEHSWYDVVITDMIMPDRDGIVICDEIHQRFPDVRIIAMSGRAGGTEGLAAALEFGAVSTLSKPFSMDELELALNLATT